MLVEERRRTTVHARGLICFFDNALVSVRLPVENCGRWRFKPRGNVDDCWCFYDVELGLLRFWNHSERDVYYRFES